MPSYDFIGLLPLCCHHYWCGSCGGRNFSPSHWQDTSLISDSILTEYVDSSRPTCLSRYYQQVLFSLSSQPTVSIVSYSSYFKISAKHYYNSYGMLRCICLYVVVKKNCAQGYTGLEIFFENFGKSNSCWNSQWSRPNFRSGY